MLCPGNYFCYIWEVVKGIFGRYGVVELNSEIEMLYKTTDFDRLETFLLNIMRNRIVRKANFKLGVKISSIIIR
ncbi:hypothetical protein A9490_13645 [Bacillus thuringiensis]|nr:hypothetical protein A9490_13645 [Bacillus thuringiensis]